MKKLIIIILVLVASQNIFAQSGWQWQNPYPTGSNLEKSFFIDENTGYVVGWDGLIIKTTNAGMNWIQQYSGCNYFLTSVYFINSNTGFVVSGDERFPTNGVILKTSNGGANWISVASLSNIGFEDVCFLNDMTGFICGTYYWSRGVIYKTTDGGYNWNVSQFQSPYSFIFSLNFVDNSTGYAAGEDSKIYKTTNSGETWSTNVIDQAGNFNSIFFADNQTGFACTSYGQIYKTFNGGVNWSQIYFSSLKNFQDIKFINTYTGFIVGSVTNSSTSAVDGIRLKTTNGGISWDSTFSNNSNILKSITVSSNAYYSAGYKGTLFKSSDGNNWTALNNSLTDLNYNKLIFADALTGYLVGQSGTIMKTTDAASSWILQNSNLFSTILDITAVDNNNIYLVSTGSQARRTTNGGINWINMDVGTSYSLNSIRFINPSTGYMCGLYSFGQFSQYHSGKVYRTTNSGVNWESIKYDDFHFYAVNFLNEHTGFLTCEPLSGNTRVLKTTDGGASWLTLNIQSNYLLSSIYFINSSTGFMGGRINGQWETYALIKTTNQGESWTDLFLDASYDMEVKSVYFVNSQKGYVTTVSHPDYGRAGDIFETSDGGNTWKHNSSQQYLPTVQWRGLNSISFINDNTGFAVGEYGTILKTTTGGTISINQISSQVPDNFLLKQNYPNPFNPSTRINYEIKNSGFVTLKVFDLLGKEVATLVNEKQNAGSYAVDFNSSEFNLPSGIYFYTLNAGEFKETRKMVLIK